MPDPFTKPQKLMNWAYDAWNAAKAEWNAAMLGKEHRLVTEEEAQTGWKVQKVVFAAIMPDTIELHLTNTLNHLKNGFDQMLFAACQAIGEPVEDAHYPWATTPVDLERKLAALNKKSGKQRIPSEFWELIRSQEPYPAADTHDGGNTIVRAVAALANAKHTIGLEMTATSFVNLGSVTFTGPGKIVFTGIPIPRAPVPYKDGVELMRWIGDGAPKPGYDYNVTISVGFDESAPPELRFDDAFAALHDFGTHFESCLNGFKRRVAELGF